MIKLKHLLPECNECGRDWNHGHDHEAGMAKNELRDMISNASKIDSMVGESDNLPGWVSAYISLAADYMHSVAEYLAGESSREEIPGPGYGIEEDASTMMQEREISPVKKVMNSVFRANGIKPVKVITTGVRGFHRYEGSGYKYEYSGLVTFHRIPAEKIEDLANQMKKAGVEVRRFSGTSIDFNPNELKTDVQGDSNLAEKKKVHNKAQQAAIAISLQKASKKPR